MSKLFICLFLVLITESCSITKMLYSRGFNIGFPERQGQAPYQPGSKKSVSRVCLKTPITPGQQPCADSPYLPSHEKVQDTGHLLKQSDHFVLTILFNPDRIPRDNIKNNLNVFIRSQNQPIKAKPSESNYKARKNGAWSIVAFVLTLLLIFLLITYLSEWLIFSPLVYAIVYWSHAIITLRALSHHYRFRALAIAALIIGAPVGIYLAMMVSLELLLGLLF